MNVLGDAAGERAVARPSPAARFGNASPSSPSSVYARPPSKPAGANGVVTAGGAVGEREGGDEQRDQGRCERRPVDPDVKHKPRVLLNAPYALRTVSERAPRILLVDDEQPIQTLLSFPLQRDGYEVVMAADGQEALTRFAEQPFDLVVLDLMLPKVDGLEVCRRMRARSAVPIIMLTAKSEEIDKVLGLELGADDYITKPFSMREFRSRVKAALRRAGMARSAATTATRRSRCASCASTRPSARSRCAARSSPTTFVEFEILSALASSPGRVFTRDMLLTRIWGDSAYRDPRTVDVHIRHLREKLETDAKEPEYIFTVRGVGYRFRDEE